MRPGVTVTLTAEQADTVLLVLRMEKLQIARVVDFHKPWTDRGQKGQASVDHIEGIIERIRTAPADKVAA